MRPYFLLALSLVTGTLVAAQTGPITGPVGFGPSTPHYVSAVIEFRDPSPNTELWPAIFHGRTVEPTLLTFSDSAIELKAPLILGADAGSLMRSGNNRRLIGEILPQGGAKEGEDKPLSLPKVTISKIDAGKKGALSFSGTLLMADKTIPIEGTGQYGRNGNDGDEVMGLSFTATFKGKALGLVKYADQDVQLVVYAAGKPGVDPSAAKAVPEATGGKKKKK